MNKQKYMFSDTPKRYDFMKAINANMITEYRNVLWFNTDKWGGEDNAMPQFLINLQQASSIHSNLLNLKYTLIKGDGLEIRDESLDNAEELEDFIDRRNKAGDNLMSVYDKCSRDMSIFEACAVQVIFDVGTGLIKEIYHVPAEDVRMEKPNKYGYIDYYYISKNWGDISNKKYKKINVNNEAVRIKSFDPTDYLANPRQLYYIKKYSPASYYAVPSYVSAIDWILIDNLIAEHEKGNLNTNYFLAGILTQQGNPTEEEMMGFINDFRTMYQGSGVKEKMLFSWVDDLAAQAPQFQAFQTQKDTDFFQALLAKTEEKIVFSHNAYPEISGMVTKSSDLGGQGNALYVGLQAFSQLVCNTLKDTLLGGFNRILEHNKLPLVAVTTPDIRTTQPMAMPDDLTKQERRWLVYGLETEEEEEEENNINIDETPQA